MNNVFNPIANCKSSIVNRKSTFFEVFQRNHKHAKALAIFFFLVFVVREMRSCQSLEIAVLDLIAGAPTVVDDDLMNGHISDAVKQNSDTDIQPEITACHDAELHIQPTWNGEDEREQVVSLKCVSCRLMVILMQRPTESVHHILVRKPSHKFHGPKGSDDPEYVDEDLHFSFKQRAASYKLSKSSLANG